MWAQDDVGFALERVLSQHGLNAKAIQSRGNTSVLVRPAWNNPVLFKPLLDNGFNSLIIPMVNSVHADSITQRRKYD